MGTSRGVSRDAGFRHRFRRRRRPRRRHPRRPRHPRHPRRPRRRLARAQLARSLAREEREDEDGVVAVGLRGGVARVVLVARDGRVRGHEAEGGDGGMSEADEGAEGGDARADARGTRDVERAVTVGAEAKEEPAEPTGGARAVIREERRAELPRGSHATLERQAAEPLGAREEVLPTRAARARQEHRGGRRPSAATTRHVPEARGGARSPPRSRPSSSPQARAAAI